MKQKIIELKKELLLVELPEDAKYVKIFHDIGRPYISYFIKNDTGRLYLNEDVEFIGKLTDIKEEGFEEWVMCTQRDDYDLFWNYKTEGYWYDTAKESFFSKLEADGIAFENKLPDPELTMRQGDGNVYYGASEEDFKDYEEAQEKVFNINRCWLFKIL